MAVSVITNGLIELQYGSAGGYSNDALITNLPSGMQAGDFIVVHVGGEGGNPRSSTAATDPFRVTMNLAGGSTASASCIAVDYGHRDNNDNIQVSVWGYVVTSTLPQSILIEYTEKTIVGGAVLRGVDTTNFTTWRDTTGDRTIEDAAAESDNTYQTNTNANTRVSDFSMNTGIIKGGWNTTNYGTEAALYMAMSHRLHIMGYALVPNTPANDSGNWEKSVFQANPPQFSSGMAIRPDSAPGTTYAITWDSQSGVSNTQRKAIVAIAIPASTSTGTLVEPICEATATGESSAVLSRVAPFIASATSEVSASAVASRAATPSAVAESSLESSATASRTANPSAVATASLTTTATPSVTRSLSASAVGQIEASATASRTTNPSVVAGSSSASSAVLSKVVNTSAEATGVGEASGTLARTTNPSASGTASGEILAQPSVSIPLHGSATATSAATVQPSRTTQASATATGTLTATAEAARTTLPHAKATASGATSGEFLTGITFNAAATGTLTGKATANRAAELQGVTTGESSAEMQASRATTLNAKATGSAEASTLTTTDDELSGIAVGSGEASATLQRIAGVRASSAASLSAVSEISRATNLSGDIEGQGEASTVLTIQGAVDILGAASGTLDASSTIQRQTLPSLSSTTSGQVQAELTRAASILGEAVGGAEVAGSLTKDKDLAGSITLEVSTEAGISVTRNISSTVLLDSEAGAVTDVTLGIAGNAEAAGAGSVVGTLSMSVKSSGEASGSARVTIGVVQAEPFLKAGAKSLVALEVLTEAITYYPGGDLTAGRSIRAVVQREEPDILALALDAGALTVQVELWIASSDISTIRAGKDLADVVVTEGKAAERIRIIEVLDDSDVGMAHVLGVR